MVTLKLVIPARDAVPIASEIWLYTFELMSRRIKIQPGAIEVLLSIGSPCVEEGDLQRGFFRR
jgi:hypothetical protein